MSAMKTFTRRLTVGLIDVIVHFTESGMKIEHGDKKVTLISDPFKRTIVAFNKKTFSIQISKIGITLKEKGSRGSGVHLEWDRFIPEFGQSSEYQWDKLILQAHGYNFKTGGIKSTCTGKTLVDRGSLYGKS
jgi:hypothetical protein